MTLPYDGIPIIAIPMEKGGSGKTTIAINLALSLAEDHTISPDKDVAAMDFDDQQNFSAAFLRMQVPSSNLKVVPQHPDFEPDNPEDAEWGGYSYSMDIYYDREIVPYDSECHEKIKIVPSDGMMKTTHSNRAKEAELNNPDIYKVLTENTYRFFDSGLGSEYKAVIIDIPPGVTLVTSPLLKTCTHVVIPVPPEPDPYDGFIKLLNELDELNRSGDRKFPVQVAAVVPNMVDSRASIHKAYLDRIYKINNSINSMAYGKVSDPISRLVDFQYQRLPFTDEHTDRILTGKAADQWDSVYQFIKKNIWG